MSVCLRVSAQIWLVLADGVICALICFTSRHTCIQVALQPKVWGGGRYRGGTEGEGGGCLLVTPANGGEFPFSFLHGTCACCVCMLHAQALDLLTITHA